MAQLDFGVIRWPEVTASSRSCATLCCGNTTWYNEKKAEPEARIGWFTSSKDNIREEVRILKVKESGLD